MPVVRILSALALLLPLPAAAHGFRVIPPDGLWAAWTLDPWVIAPLLLLHWLYGRGLLRLWARAGVGHGVGRLQAAAFFLGEAALILALVWPFDALGETLFSAHMIQHMLLMTVAAPLLILGAPLTPLLWSLPERWRAPVGRWASTGSWARLLDRLSQPMMAALLQAVALWAWHAPAAFQAARFDDWLHALEHASFLGTALLFWWAMIHSPKRGIAAPGRAAFWMLVTVIQGGLLGALITFATRPLYPSYGDAPLLWGMTPLQDQQLAGLIMWVPAGLLHLLGGVALVGVWLRALERRSGAA